MNDYDDEDDDDEEIGLNEATSIQMSKKPSATSTPQQRRENVGATPASTAYRHDEQQQHQQISEAPQLAPQYSGPKFGTMDINGDEMNGGEDGGQKERQPFRGPRQ